LNQTAAFEEAVATMNAIRKAAASGDTYAATLLAMSEKNPAAFIAADLSNYRPRKEGF